MMRAQGRQAGRCDGLQERRGTGSGNAVLHHVADVEERGVAACKVVRGADGEGIVLYGHVEAAEGDHLSPMG